MTAPLPADPVKSRRLTLQVHGLTEVAASQRSLITAGQLRQLGYERGAVDRLIGRGVLAVFRQGIYLVAGASPDIWRPLHAAALAAGRIAAASHFASGGLHGYPGILRGAVELTVFGRASGDLADVRVHETTRPFDIVVVSGIPATTPARTLSDLAGAIHPDFLDRLVAFSLEHRLCSLDDLRLETGRRGRRALLAAIQANAEGSPDLQGMYRRLLRRSGLPPFVEEHQVVLEGKAFSIDFAWPEHKVGVEPKGFGPHGSRPTFDRDAVREATLTSWGWRLVPATSRSDPAKVLSALRRLLSPLSP